MKPLSLIYWSRVILGFIAGVITAIIGFDDLLTSISISVLIYLLAYYIYKMKFLGSVEKPTSLITMGIGAYYLAWVVSWVLLYNLIYPSKLMP